MNGYLNIHSTRNLNIDQRGDLRSNLEGITAAIVQMKTDGNLFTEDTTGKTTASREIETLQAEQENIEAKIAAYMVQEQAKLDRETEAAKAKARSEYNKDLHGIDEEAYVEKEVSKNTSLQRKITVPENLQAELNSNKSFIKMAQSKETVQLENKGLVDSMIANCIEENSDITGIDITA